MTDYPPPGTRVRWRSQGGGKWSTKEGIVAVIVFAEAWESKRAFRWAEVYGHAPHSLQAETLIRTDDGTLYHPRPEWLEIVEEASDA